MSTSFESSLLFREERGRRGTRATDNSGGWVVHSTVIDPNVPRIINGQGYIHRRELVEGGNLEICHAAGKEAKGQRGLGRTTDDRDVI